MLRNFTGRDAEVPRNTALGERHLFFWSRDKRADRNLRIFFAEGTEMNVRSCNLLRTVLVAGGLLIAPMLANAEIVSTDQLVAKSSTDAERARIEAFLDRASATGQLQAFGVKGIDAQTRISALSDAEVHELAAKIDSLPAGGNVAGFTDQQIVIVLLLLILVVILVTA